MPGSRDPAPTCAVDPRTFPCVASAGVAPIARLRQPSVRRGFLELMVPLLRCAVLVLARKTTTPRHIVQRVFPLCTARQFSARQCPQIHTVRPVTTPVAHHSIVGRFNFIAPSSLSIPPFRCPKCTSHPRTFCHSPNPKKNHTTNISAPAITAISAI